PTTGETATYTLKVRNNGSGVARGVTAKLRSLDAQTTVTDSTALIGDIAPYTTTQGDPFVFHVNGPGGKLQLEISDALQVRQVQTLDLTFPVAPFNVTTSGEADAVKLTWDANPDSDLAGYNIYRSTSAAGPFTNVNVVPTDRIAYSPDESWPPLTRFFPRAAAVDSPGNEPAFSNAVFGSTTPPHHAIFPVPTNGTTPSSVAVEYAYSTNFATIAAGSEVLYVLN